MLQNRVDPSGKMIVTPSRGAWLGNRGVLHNDKQEIVRPYKLKAWITCVLEFRGRHREVMQPNRWTELFFLDEATAFSAGHRPCFQCRFADHQKFKAMWIKGNPQYGFTMKTPIASIDNILQLERIAPDKSKVTYQENLTVLPDGTFVLYRDKPHLLKDNALYLWAPDGYKKTSHFFGAQELPVLTTKSIVHMLRAGYIPQMGI